jgi:hypothetical protein
MPRRTSNPSTAASTLRADVEALLVHELGYPPAVAKRMIARHEGLMLKAVRREQPVRPIAVSIHLAHQHESQPVGS